MSRDTDNRDPRPFVSIVQSDLLADCILVGPVLVRQDCVNDGYELGAMAIFVAKLTPLQDGNAKSRKVLFHQMKLSCFALSVTEF